MRRTAIVARAKSGRPRPHKNTTTFHVLTRYYQYSHGSGALALFRLLRVI